MNLYCTTPFDRLDTLRYSINRMVDFMRKCVTIDYTKELTEMEKADFELKARSLTKHSINFEWSEQLASGDKYKPYFELKITNA